MPHWDSRVGVHAVTLHKDITEIARILQFYIQTI